MTDDVQALMERWRRAVEEMARTINERLVPAIQRLAPTISYLAGANTAQQDWGDKLWPDNDEETEDGKDD